MGSRTALGSPPAALPTPPTFWNRFGVVIGVIAGAVGTLLGGAGTFLVLSTPSATADTGNNFTDRFNIGDLPACTDSVSRNGRSYIVLDAVDVFDATVGGNAGAEPHGVVCNGATSTWISTPAATGLFPMSRVALTVQLAVPNDTETMIPFDVESFDDAGITNPPGWIDLGTDPTKTTPDFLGRLSCSVFVNALAPAAGGAKTVCLSIFFNGFAVGNRACVLTPDNEHTALQFDDVLPVTPGDFFQLSVYTPDAVGLTIEAARVNCERKT